MPLSSLPMLRQGVKCEHLSRERKQALVNVGAYFVTSVKSYLALHEKLIMT